MSTRVKTTALGAVAMMAAAATVLAAIPLSAAAAKRAVRRSAASSSTVTVVERAVTDTTVYVGGGGAKQDVTGNLLTFHNLVYNPSDTRVVGSDLGVCVRVKTATAGVTPPDGSYTCEWTTFLPRGQITVTGPFYDSKNSVLAITGGTGAYRTARGEMNLISRKGGAEYDFVFHLSR